MMKYLIIKCGGSIFEQIPSSFYEEIVNIQKEGEYYPIIVHGGGPAITNTLTRLNIETTFVNGLRKTTEDVLNVVEMMLSGSLNKQIVRHLVKAGGSAIGISGVDGMLLEAKPVSNANEIGLVGEVTHVNVKLLKLMEEQNLIPVVSPLGIDQFGQHYNINADIAAAAIAESLNGTICLITDVEGVIINGNVQTVLTEKEVEYYIESEQITGGMIPKVRSAIDCLKSGASEVVILNGREVQALSRFSKGEKIGTTFSIDYLEV